MRLPIFHGYLSRRLLLCAAWIALACATGCGPVHDAGVQIYTGAQNAPEDIVCGEFYAAATPDDVRAAIAGRPLGGVAYTARSARKHTGFFGESFVDDLGFFIPTLYVRETILTPVSLAMYHSPCPDEVVPVLVEAGADVSNTDLEVCVRSPERFRRATFFELMKGASPPVRCDGLALACVYGDTALVEQSLTDFPDTTPNCVSGLYHGTVFTKAITLRNIHLVALLLDHGADVNLTDVHAMRPIDVALLVGNMDIVSLLLDRGAVLEEGNAKDELPLLFRAVMFGKIQDRDLLLRLARIAPVTGYGGEKALRAACYSAMPEVVDVLLARGAAFVPGVTYLVGKTFPGKEDMLAYLAGKNVRAREI